MKIIIVAFCLMACSGTVDSVDPNINNIGVELTSPVNCQSDGQSYWDIDGKTPDELAAHVFHRDSKGNLSQDNLVFINGETMWTTHLCDKVDSTVPENVAKWVYID